MALELYKGREREGRARFIKLSDQKMTRDDRFHAKNVNMQPFALAIKFLTHLRFCRRKRADSGSPRSGET